MTPLWVENRRAPPSSGRTHALVIGVSAYDNLPADAVTAPALGAVTFGLQQLRSAAASAWAFANWLKASYNNPDAPLGTVRLLLSPSKDELAQFPELAAARYQAATAANVKRALLDWRKDCCGPDARKEDVAILYAAGHGITLTKDEGGIVLLQDFADPYDNILGRALDIPGVRRAMYGPDVAQNQFFLIDACQVRPEALAGVEVRGGIGLDGPIDHPPAVSAIYMSATPGTLALGRPGRGTLFSDALIDCLDRLAVMPDENGRWVVRDTDLIGPLFRRVMELAAQHGLEQRTTSGGIYRGVLLHAPDAAPVFEVSFMVNPDEASTVAYATVSDGNGTKILEKRCLHPELVAPMAAGAYSVAVSIDPETPPYADKQIACFISPQNPKPIVVTVI